jgi:alcohol dehydrogenase (cytochrome c)
MKPALVVVTILAVTSLPAQVQNYKPVTTEMLLNPSADDWLMYSRTYDAQRFSPLKQINRENVNQLSLAWSRGLAAGATETIPLVHNGVMYVVTPGAAVQALDAITGDLLWEYKRKLANPGQAASARTKTIAIFQGILVYTAPDSYVVGLDATTGEQRWQTKADDRGHTSGALVVEGLGRDRRNLHGRAACQLLYLGLRCRNRQRSLEVLYDSRARRSQPRHLGRRTRGKADRLNLGPARHL